MIFDRLSSLFEENDIINKAASATTAGRIIDLRLNGGLDDHLKVVVLCKGKPSATTTLLLETLDDGASWVKLGEQSPNGNVLYAGDITGHKRYLRATLKVGGTAITGDFSCKGGLVDCIEVGSVNIQKFDPETGKPQDLNETSLIKDVVK